MTWPGRLLTRRTWPPIVAALILGAITLDRAWSGPWSRSTWRPGLGPIHHVDFSPDGKLLRTGGYGWTTLLDIAAGTSIPQSGNAPGWPGLRDHASADGSLRLKLSAEPGDWRRTRLSLTETATGRILRDFRPHPDQLNDAAISPDGRILATAGGFTAHPWPVNPAGDARLWDARTGRLLLTLNRHWGAVSSVAISPDGKALATGCYDGTVRIWNLDRLP